MGKSSSTHSERFRLARERAGLSVTDVALEVGVSAASIYDLEAYDDELVQVYSPIDLRRFASVLASTPVGLLGLDPAANPLSPVGLAAAVTEFCRARSIDVAALEATSGWELASTLRRPERFLHDFSIAGIRDVCDAIGIGWDRFVVAL
jgi:transcriptional regulator with XRE-family HTH domain